MILNDKEIRRLGPDMLDPFEPGSVRKGVISYGVSSFGYDIRVGHKFQIFTPNPFKTNAVDPKNFDNALLRKVDTDEATDGAICIPPNSYALGMSMEYFHMPVDVMGLVVGKSTYARCGIIVNVTPLEPGWEGFVTIEISNSTPLPAKIYAEEGIAQVLFFKGKTPMTNYADKKGKYQGQTDITPPKVE